MKTKGTCPATPLENVLAFHGVSFYRPYESKGAVCATHHRMLLLGNCAEALISMIRACMHPSSNVQVPLAELPDCLDTLNATPWRVQIFCVPEPSAVLATQRGATNSNASSAGETTIALMCFVSGHLPAHQSEVIIYL